MLRFHYASFWNCSYADAGEDFWQFLWQKMHFIDKYFQCFSKLRCLLQFHLSLFQFWSPHVSPTLGGIFGSQTLSRVFTYISEAYSISESNTKICKVYLWLSSIRHVQESEGYGLCNSVAINKLHLCVDALKDQSNVALVIISTHKIDFVIHSLIQSQNCICIVT